MRRDEETKKSEETADATKRSERASKSNRNRTNSRKGGTNVNKGSSRSTPFDDIQIIKDMAQFPLSNPLGTEFAVGDNGSTSKSRIPGVMAFGVVPLQYETGYNSPLNIAARNVYAYVTHANSRNASYEATDLMIYIMGVANLYSIWSHCVRAYGVAKQYSVMNRYIPETLLAAMGFKPDDIRVGLNDFRGALNLIANKASTLVIPSSFAYTTELFEMYNAVYADGENSRSQLYVFNPGGYYMYNATKYETGGCLEYIPFARSTFSYTWTEWINMLNQMLDRLLLNQDINIMAADIIKAFGDNLYGLMPISEDYTVTPVYDDEMLETIMNIAILPGTAPESSTHGWDLHQFISADPNSAPALAWYAQSAINDDIQAYMDHKIMLNTCYESLTPAQVVHRTKFNPAVEKYNDTIVSLFPRSFIIRTASIFFKPTGDGTTSYINVHESLGDNTATTLALLSNFHHAPLIMNEADATGYEFIHGDVENITFITHKDIDRLNDVVTQVLFNVATVYPIK